MLTFKHGIVHQMVVQILILNLSDFIGHFRMQPMDVRQWASCLSSEVVDVIVP